MPERTGIKSVLIPGAGPTMTDQAREFDYPGVQVCRALREEGCRVILVNSSPATIVTDPTMADTAYIEPIRWATVTKIIKEERPDALSPTTGGQTVLNCTLDLEHHGVLEKLGVGTTGANADTVDKAKDRSRFGRAMRDIGLACSRPGIAHSMEEAYGVLKQIGFPYIIRPFFTMGGTDGGIAYNREGFEEICVRGLDLSSANELLIDESLIGWREYEMEVARDKKDNCIIVCSIENFDPVGVHTGDSITVAPVQTPVDKEYQIMRNALLVVLREIGVETGGSNVQFGICPNTGRVVVIGMNPWVSRSSALASKATGFPIVKTTTKLVVGCTLDELQNDIAGDRTPASFGPAIDYVVTKVLHFALEKFPKADARLTTQMESINEVMVIGWVFQESVRKALRGLGTGAIGFDLKLDLNNLEADSVLKCELTMPSAEHVRYAVDAFHVGKSVEEVFELTRIDEWFPVQIEDLVRGEKKAKTLGLFSTDCELIHKLKRKGLSDACLTKLLGVTEKNLRSHRHRLKMLPVYKHIDTCVTEFATDTTHVYSAYERECKVNPSNREKIMILSGDPNRISQGIGFSYCYVHAVLAMREDGYETVTINCNSETVSTDYDASNRLYFGPMTLGDVLEAVRIGQPKGVIVQYGGQTPPKSCRALEEIGVPITDISPDAIGCAENRERFQQMVQHLDPRQPTNATARSEGEALAASKAIGYSLVVHPSYVLGGRAMEIAYQEEELKRYMRETVQASNDSPVLLDHFLNRAIEVDINAICDGGVVVIGTITQHIEQTGVHSGDSAYSLPPYSLPQHT